MGTSVFGVPRVMPRGAPGCPTPPLRRAVREQLAGVFSLPGEAQRAAAGVNLSQDRTDSENMDFSIKNDHFQNTTFLEHRRLATPIQVSVFERRPPEKARF